jgi:hypothetical protein
MAITLFSLALLFGIVSAIGALDASVQVIDGNLHFQAPENGSIFFGKLFIKLCLFELSLSFFLPSLNHE